MSRYVTVFMLLTSLALLPLQARAQGAAADDITIYHLEGRRSWQERKVQDLQSSGRVL